MPQHLLRRAAASASELRLILNATFGAANLNTDRDIEQDSAAFRRRRAAKGDARLERLEL